MTTLRLIVFTLLIPATIAVYIPHWLLQPGAARFDIGGWHIAGMLFMLAGGVFYLVSALAFLLEGGGTPAIWFTRPLKAIIGEEPATLVRGALYRHTRNPMYAGVLLVVVGEAIWFEAAVLLAYSAVVWLFFHLAVVLVEEPHLRKKNGAAYEEYCRAVPRWFIRLRRD